MEWPVVTQGSSVSSVGFVWGNEALCSVLPVLAPQQLLDPRVPRLWAWP